jgi:23S rRNA (pseudouridine1915-N3)-methyltransferase
MHMTLAHIGQKPGAKDCLDAMVQAYLERCALHALCSAKAFGSEAAMFDWLDQQKKGRKPLVPVLFDSRGRQMSSEAFARWLGERRDRGTQQILFAIGGADGWSEEARQRCAERGDLISLGPMTLPHALARLVAAEQIYRAFTILSGHPYHCGH